MTEAEERVLGSALKMQQIHRTVKRLWGSDFDEEMDKWVAVLTEAQKRLGMESPLSVMVKLLSDGDFDGFERLFIIAAAVEAVERKSTR